MTDPKTINPKDPVAVLRAAAQELEARRDDPRFVIDMDDYHVASTTPCRICLAGTVMCGLPGTARVFQPLLAPARYKGAFGGRGSGKSHFFAELADAFNALNMFRLGGVSYYLASFGIDQRTLLKAHERFDGKWKWKFDGGLSPQEIDELISHCHTVADWLEDQGRKDNE